MPLASFLRSSARFLGLAGACLLVSPLAPLRAQTPSAADGFDPNANGLVNSVVVQSNGQIILAGAFTTLQPNGAAGTTVRNRIARINPDGTVDASFNPNANDQIYTAVLQGDGKILIGGAFTSLQPNGAATATTRNHIARLNTDGTVDATFNPNATGPLVAQVFSLAVQSNGQILIGGAFSSLQPNGAAAVTTRNHIARLNPDGSLDAAFNPNVSAAVLAIAVQPNGQILIGGGFTNLQPNGASAAAIRNHFARLNFDGTLDTNFDPSPNGSINTIAIQEDNRIVIGGSFGTLTPNGVPGPTTANNLARVQPDGTMDLTFNPSPNSSIMSVVIQKDGKILVGGSFIQLFPVGSAAGSTASHIARLNADGSIDAGFSPSCNGVVNSIAVQADGRVVFGGNFTQVFANSAIATSARNSVARVNPDGSLDATFNPDDNGRILAMAQQADGKVLLGGTLTSIGGVTRTGLARVTATGNLDTTFNPILNGAVTRIVVQADGKIIVLGTFTNVNAVTRNTIARLNADGTLDTGYNPNPNASVISAALQADGKLFIAGNFSAVQPNGSSTVTAMSGLARLNTDGSLDTSLPNLSPDSRVNVVAVQPDGKFVIAGEFTSVAPNGATTFTQRNFMARFNPDGTLDTAFDPNFNNSVTSMAIQADGRIIAGGNFTQIAPNEVTPALVRGHLVRLNTNGTVDTNFDPEPNGLVNSIAVQPDGHVLIAGLFTTVQPNLGVAVYSRNSFARLNVDGSIDQSFIPQPNTAINAVLVQTDGTFFAAGGFTTINNTAVDHLVLFNANGTINTSFVAQANAVSGSTVSGIALQNDGRLVVAGNFTGLAGALGVNLARFNPDSSPDATFNANADGPINAAAVLFSSVPVPTQDVGLTWVTSTGALRTSFGSDTIATISGSVAAVAVQSDGRVVVAGDFRNTSGVTGNNILRLTAAGKLDSSYDPSPNNLISGMVLQPDGKLIIVGAFTSLAPNAAATSVARNFIARLNTDGTVDANFNPNVNGSISAVTLQPDGKILIGGAFSNVDPNVATTSYIRENMARLNPDGTVDVNFNPNVNGSVTAITVQPNGQILIGGAFASLQPNAVGNNITRNFAARLNADGTLDTSFDPEPNLPVNGILLQSDGKILLAGSFNTLQPALGTTIITRNHIARVNSDGSVDMGYDPNINGTVNAISLLPSGKVLAGGSFFNLSPNGAPTPTTRIDVVLLNTDGTIDASFDPAPNGTVNAIAVQGDGSVLFGGSFTALQPVGALLVGGAFSHLSNVAVANLALLNNDGSPNTAFSAGANGPVSALAVQANGQVVVGGAFTSVGGAARNRVARLNADNTLDAAFNPNANGLVDVAALQPNGQIVLAGSFSSVGGAARNNAARVNADGSVDSFNPNVNGTVFTAVVQANGQVVLGGAFSSVGGAARNNVARVNADGSLDASFNPNANGPVNALSLQVNGQIVLGGAFSSVGGAGHANLARINADGSADATFTASTDGAVTGLAFQPDGKLFVGGAFSHVNGLTRFRFGRLGETSGASQSLSVSSSFNSVTWTRTGSAPELSQVEFQVSLDAATWSNLGAGTRVGTSGSWQLSGISLPGGTIFYVRALGLAPTAEFSSSSLIQSVQQFDSATGVTGSSVAAGSSTVSATSTATVTAQALTASLVTAPAASATGAASSAAADPTAATAGRLITFSSRADIAAANPLVAGFTLSGANAKTVLLRAVGPGLGAFGVTGTLPNPSLQLYDSAGHLMLATAGWSGDSALAALFNQVGAFPLAAGSADAATVASLLPGSYTLRVAGATGQSGAALAEVYDADSDPLTAQEQISAVSAHAVLEAGGSLVGGFAVTGGSTQTVLVRAIGPALGAAGLSAPVLSVYDGQGNLLARNAGWANAATVNGSYPAATATTIATAASAAGAAGLGVGSNDSAVVLTLPAGAYTAQVTDAQGQAGVAQVEVYKLTP